MKEVIIIGNGPSVKNIKNFDINNKSIIAVNRWNSIFKKFNLPDPNYVIIGANSLEYNLNNIYNKKNIKFFCCNNYLKKNNTIYSIKNNNLTLLKFGNLNVYNSNINFYDKLWWSGFYCLQLALILQYDKIHIFGMDCDNNNDYDDNYSRTNIPIASYNRIILFLNELKKIKNYKDIIKVYNEDNNNLIRRVLDI